MRKIWWSLAAIVVVALLGFFVAPWVYALSPAGQALAQGNPKEGG